MQFTTALIASILAVAATAAPGAAAAADLEKRQVCAVDCTAISDNIDCITNANSIIGVILCAGAGARNLCNCLDCVPQLGDVDLVQVICDL